MLRQLLSEVKSKRSLYVWVVKMDFFFQITMQEKLMTVFLIYKKLKLSSINYKSSSQSATLTAMFNLLTLFMFSTLHACIGFSRLERVEKIITSQSVTISIMTQKFRSD